jgi:hypothetical protein
MATNWIQLLKDELQKRDDKDLRCWPVEWWTQLKTEGMDPLQAIKYTMRIMHKRT